MVQCSLQLSPQNQLQLEQRFCGCRRSFGSSATQESPVPMPDLLVLASITIVSLLLPLALDSLLEELELREAVLLE
jgi:hypothetical protein